MTDYLSSIMDQLIGYGMQTLYVKFHLPIKWIKDQLNCMVFKMDHSREKKSSVKSPSLYTNI